MKRCENIKNALLTVVHNAFTKAHIVQPFFIVDLNYELC